MRCPSPAGGSGPRRPRSRSLDHRGAGPGPARSRRHQLDQVRLWPARRGLGLLCRRGDCPGSAGMGAILVGPSEQCTGRGRTGCLHCPPLGAPRGQRTEPGPAIRRRVADRACTCLHHHDPVGRGVRDAGPAAPNPVSQGTLADDAACIGCAGINRRRPSPGHTDPGPFWPAARLAVGSPDRPGLVVDDSDRLIRTSLAHVLDPDPE